MKVVFFLCALTVAVSVVASKKDNEYLGYDIDESFFDKAGLGHECAKNQVFRHYSLCEKRCDQLEVPKDCDSNVEYVGCACDEGYISDTLFSNNCFKQEDCPK